MILIPNSNKKVVDDALASKADAKALNDYKQITDTTINQLKETKAGLSDVAKISIGTPLFASDTSKMTETTRNYVNTTDGYLYIYTGGSWTKTNVQYQSTGIENNSVGYDKLVKNLVLGYTPKHNIVKNSMNGNYKYIPVTTTSGNKPIAFNVKAENLPFNCLGIPNWIKAEFVNGFPTSAYITTFWGEGSIDYMDLDISNVGKKITLSCYIFSEQKLNFKLMLAFRNKVGTYLSSTDYSTVTTDGVDAKRLEVSAIIPPNTERLTMQLQCVEFGTLSSYYLGCPQLLIGDTTYRISENITDAAIRVDNIYTNLVGKTCLTLGDSIMYGAGNNGIGIGDILQEKYQIINEDVSVSGTTLSKGVLSDRGSILDQLANVKSSNPDFIIFDGGINDVFFRESVSLGNIIEFAGADMATSGYGSFDTKTAIGSLERLIMDMNLKFPKSKIIYVFPHKMGAVYYSRSDKPYSMVELREKAIKVCEKWGVELVDVFGRTRLNTSAQLRDYYSEYCPDGVHLNRSGYDKYYIPLILEKLNIN